MSLRTPILADALHHIDLEAIKREKGEANGSHSLVATDHVRSTLICQKPGTETDIITYTTMTSGGSSWRARFIGRWREKTI